jgi:hypothetical protein
MSTDIYNKPTDKHQYRSPQSCHPKHCTKGIPYSQALRIKRICSNEQTTKKRLGELKCHLKKRGYNNASINHCYNKASGIDRKDLIQYKEKNANNRVPFVITYHPALSNLSNIVREHWTTFGKLKVTIIDHNAKWDDKSRQERESFWIRKRKMESMKTSNILS